MSFFLQQTKKKICCYTMLSNVVLDPTYFHCHFMDKNCWNVLQKVNDVNDDIVPLNIIFIQKAMEITLSQIKHLKLCARVCYTCWEPRLFAPEELTNKCLPASQAHLILHALLNTSPITLSQFHTHIVQFTGTSRRQCVQAEGKIEEGR